MAILSLILSCMVIAGVASALIALYSIPDRKIASAGPQQDPVPPASAVAAGRPDPAPVPILARLPLHLRGEIAYLSMQDHYVDVHTVKGSTLLLMRFADAVPRPAVSTGCRSIGRTGWRGRPWPIASAGRDAFSCA